MIDKFDVFENQMVYLLWIHLYSFKGDEVMKVSVVMGSKSDMQVMKEATEILESFEIEVETKIVSAHRTPDFMYRFAKENDSDIIIAGAGGSAHLPGMIAAISSKPVIGVPIKSKMLNGVDSLLSIVQMPKGVPVATVAINGASNAALLAISFLSITDEVISKRYDEYRIAQTKEVLADE